MVKGHIINQFKLENEFSMLTRWSLHRCLCWTLKDLTFGVFTNLEHLYLLSFICFSCPLPLICHQAFSSPLTWLLILLSQTLSSSITNLSSFLIKGPYFIARSHFFDKDSKVGPKTMWVSKHSQATMLPRMSLASWSAQVHSLQWYSREIHQAWRITIKKKCVGKKLHPFKHGEKSSTNRPWYTTQPVVRTFLDSVEFGARKY